MTNALLVFGVAAPFAIVAAAAPFLIVDHLRMRRGVSAAQSTRSVDQPDAQMREHERQRSNRLRRSNLDSRLGQ
jgi:hypothetical protein